MINTTPQCSFENSFTSYQKVLLDPQSEVNENTNQIYERIFNSPLVHSIGGLGISFAGAIGTSIAVLPTVSSVATIFYICKHAKKILYEISLLPTIITNNISPNFFPWFADIIPGKIALGAIPLKNRGHIQSMLESGISSILILLEPHELEPSIYGEPATSSDWDDANVSNLTITTPDFQPMSLKDIDNGVEFLKNRINNNNKVYVHCKAGRGRSATTVVCYLLKYGSDHGLSFNDVDDAIEYVKSRRPVININSRQKQAIIDYWEKYCQ